MREATKEELLERLEAQELEIEKLEEKIEWYQKEIQKFYEHMEKNKLYKYV